MQNGKRQKRRKIIINQPFQWRYSITVFFAALLAVIVTALSISWLYLFKVNKAVLCDTNDSLLLIITVSSAIVILLSVLWALFYSHSIAGPVTKVVMVLRQAKNGDYSGFPLRFRKGDSFTELADSINEFVDSLKSEQNKILDIENMVRQIIKEFGYSAYGDKDILSKLEIIYKKISTKTKE